MNRYWDEMNIFKIKPSSLNEGSHSCISLFSGSLGMDLGLHAAGFSTRACLDFDKDALMVSQHNFPKLPYLCEDITSIKPKLLLREGGLLSGKVDLLAGGPPCQPFSKSGQRKGLNDNRGELFKHYIEILGEIQPRAFILENVRGLVSSGKGEDLKVVLKSFKETGYTLYTQVLDAANYGVPQFRQRIFIVGFKNKIKFTFPEICYGQTEEDSFPFQVIKPFITVKEAIGDLENRVEGQAFTGKYKDLLAEIPEGLNYSHYTKERGHKDPLFEWRSKFWYFLLKIDREKPSLTIQAYPGNNTGPFHWKNRRLDIKEIARLQTFPDWFNFPVSYMKAHKLIGNAVPCVLAYKIGLKIKEALTNNEKADNSRFVEAVSILKCVSGRGSGKGRHVLNEERDLVAR